MNIKGNRSHDLTPVIKPVKRVAMGTELEDLQARLASLRRRTQVYPTGLPAKAVSRQQDA
jgi:hypothetical protein